MATGAVAIRDAILTRLQSFSDYNRTRKTHVRQLQAEDLPSLSAVVMSEDMSPDGQGNAGVPSFIVSSTIAISIARGFKTPDELDGDIDADAEGILDTLLSDTSFVGFPGPDPDDPNPAIALFESIEKVSRRRNEVQNGETYLTELRIEMTFVSRIYFEPNVPDHYKGMTITTYPYNDLNAPPVVAHVDEPDWT